MLSTRSCIKYMIYDYIEIWHYNAITCTTWATHLGWGGGRGGGEEGLPGISKWRWTGSMSRLYIWQACMEKEKLLVSPSWKHYRATGHTVINVMIRPGHGKMCYIYLVTDTIGYQNSNSWLWRAVLLLYKWREFWPAREPCVGPTQGRIGQIGLGERREAVIKTWKTTSTANYEVKTSLWIQLLLKCNPVMKFP